MKRVIAICVLIITLLSCSKMDDNYKQYLNETIYPGKVSDVSAEIGIEKVFLYWTPPSDPKSNKIMVKYTQSDSIITEGLVASLIVNGLNESKGYEFEIRSLDEYGNRSVAEYITAKPMTKVYVENNIVPSEPVFIFNTTSQTGVITWEKLTTSIMRYTSGNFVLNVDGKEFSDELIEKRRGKVEIELPGINLKNASYTLNYSMTFWPLQANGDPIAETVTRQRSTSRLKIVE